MKKGLILCFDDLKKKLKRDIKTCLKENKAGTDILVDQVVDTIIDEFVMGENKEKT